MNAVLMSIRPKWCELIASGKKTIEVRKTKPKIETPFKVYIYCTMGGLPKHIYNENLEKESIYVNHPDIINGKVIGEFVCNDIEPYTSNCTVFESVLLPSPNDLAKMCLTLEELNDYGTRGKLLYGWHISNLVIYDNPKDLSEFEKPWYDIHGNYHDIRPCENGKGCEHEYFDYSENCPACDIDYSGDNCPYTRFTRPPQSWCYVEL